MSDGNLIDRYVIEVGNHLPRRTRADVQLELHSTLHDAMEERGIDPASPAHEEQVVALLKEYGEPHKVAAGYGQRRFVVGPELQSSYWLVLRLAAVGVTAAQIVRLIVAASQGEPIDIGDVVGSLVASLLIGFAVVSLIFATLEYFLPDINLPVDESFDFARAKRYGQPGGWDPRSLPEIMLDYDKINRFEIVVELLFAAAFIYVVNSFSQWNLAETLGGVQGGAAVITQLINAVQPFIPAITALAIVNVGIRVILLVRGRWETWTRWAEILYYVSSGAIFGALLAAAPYTGNALVDNIARLSIGMSLTVCVIYTMAMLYRVMKLRPNDRLPWRTNNARTG
jgi:hypothetical protein